MTLLAQKPQTKYRLLAGIIPTILLLMSFFLVSTASSNITIRSQNLQQIKVKQQAYAESVSLNQFVTDNLTSLEQMSTALPSESMMVGVTQDFEAVIRQYDPNGSVKFASQTPIKAGPDLIIPVNIAFQSTPAQVGEVISRIRQLPYITQIQTTDTQVSGEIAQTNINLRLYVQEPFAGN